MTTPPSDASATGAVDRTPTRGSEQHGRIIVRANLVGTVLFVGTAIFAAAAFTTTAQWVGASTAMSLFAVGVFAFLWGFWNAVQRSREEEVSVTQLFMLLGTPTPPDVRRPMLALLLVQIITAFATTFWRLDGPDGTPGSSLAVGMLVPMFGLGMNGLWAAYHADFDDRDVGREIGRSVGTPSTEVGSEGSDGGTNSSPIGQNETHG